GEQFNLTNLTQEVVSDADFEARSISRRVEGDLGEPCIVVGHEELIRSAVENVVRNAVRHTPEDTSVIVSLHVEESSPKSQAVLRVFDRGPGVPDAMLTEIFRPFTRAFSGAEGNGGGAGLGLAIAQKAVAVHAGSIRAM